MVASVDKNFKKVSIPTDLPQDVNLSDNARTVLQKRYVRKDEQGKPVETEAEMFWRVAYHVALAEKDQSGTDSDVDHWAREYYKLLTELRFFPNSPTFTGAGTPLGQLAACFVLAVEDDMGRTGQGIFETLRNAALIQQTGGGNGFSFSRLRPKGAIVKSSSGAATGPVGFLRVYDQAFGEIAQGGCLRYDTLIFTEQGLLRLDEIVLHSEPGWQPHQFHVPTDEGLRPSYQGYNNGVAPVLRVQTNAGIELTGTPNHKLKVMTADGAQWRRFDALQPGDSIMVVLGQHMGQIQSLMQPSIQHGNQILPLFPTILDEELAFFLGYLMGDGFIAADENDHRVGVSIAHGSYLIAEMPQLLARLFGEHVRVHIQQKADDASLTLVIDNRAIKDFLLLNGLGKPKSTLVTIPRLIRQSPPQIAGAFLRGLFEADGALSHSYPMLSSTSEELIRQVATLLIGLGCPVRVFQRSNHQNRYGTQPIWCVKIQSHRGLDAWKEQIGCDSRSRFAGSMNFEPNLNQETSYPLPIADYWIRPVIDAITLPQRDIRERGKNKNLRASQPKLRRDLLRYARGERQLTLSGYAQLAETYAEFAEHARPIENLWFISVTAVQSAGEMLTLDLEVEENHTYLAHGVVSHNSRRGANMAVLRVDHPDVREFIQCKTVEGAIENFNISVGITDKFMQAVKNDEMFDLINPQDGSVWESVRAREIFDMIVEHAHHNGEPGVLFLDQANRENPVPHLYELEATNPCGEQWLGPFENCCLGSVNLAQHYTEDGRVDWDKLRESIELSTRFLDHVVTANAYVPAVPQLREAAERVRRIGLGIMGLGDMMYALGVRYGSPDGQEFASQIMEFVRYHTMRTSIDLAKDKGTFTAIEGSRYDPNNLKWTIPHPLVPHVSDWGRPTLDWHQIEEDLYKHGIRNGAQCTVAPTGTIATVSGCEGYGCEPVFALAYTRYMVENAGNSKERRELQYTSPLFEKALLKAGLPPEKIDRVVGKVNQSGSCQDVLEVPDEIRRVFVVSGDITAEEHIRMQATMQAWVDNAISKTVNAPATATEDDVAKAYFLGWELGCKGLTVYVTGSREKVVLETKATREQKEKSAEASQADSSPSLQQVPLFNEEKKPRPRRLDGKTYRTETPAGTTYIVINENGHGEGHPFEVFVHTAKAGSEVMAVSEAVGRLISYVLRMSSPVSPRKRLKEIIRQLSGIGGERSLGIGPNRVRSLPDGIAQILSEYIEETAAVDAPATPTKPNQPTQAELPLVTSAKPHTLGDLCPSCGAATFIYEEGCQKCYSCGFSRC